MSEPGGSTKPKTLGRAIDEMISALHDLSSDAERRNAIQTVLNHFNLGEPPVSAPSRDLAESVAPEDKTVTTKVIDIRTLKDQKQPSTANEMAAVVAYYLQELAPAEERKSEVDVSDMEVYFKRAGFPLPRVPRVILQNAKAAGYFTSAARGKFKLNPVGYNLVAHNLPRGEEAAPVRRPVKKSAAPKAKKPRSK